MARSARPPSPPRARWGDGLIRLLLVLLLVASVALLLVLRVEVLPRSASELLRYVPYPAWLVPALLGCLLSLRLGWRWRLASLVAPAVVLVGVMGLAWGAPEAGDGAVRVMTYNIKAYKAGDTDGGFQALAWEIATHDPDVLVAQDAVGLAPGDDPKQLPEPLKAALKGRTVWLRGQYLMASRLPMRECTVHALPGRHHPLHYVRCIVTAEGRDIDLVNVHFLSPRVGLNAVRHERAEGVGDWRENLVIRLQQSSELARQLAGGSRPLIVAGDLNAPEESPVIAPLLSLGLRDAYSSAARGWGYTHGHSLRLGWSFLRIDHILVSPDLGVREAFAGGKDASEHRPVIADLWTRRP